MGVDEVRARLAVRQSVRECSNCGLRGKCSSPVPFSGPAPAQVAVIGEAPGETEDREGQPFVGPSGVLARQWLSEAGLDPNSLSWLNVVSCYPHRTPTPKEVQACKDNVVRQLELIAPEYLLLLGGIAVSHWWGTIRMGDIRGLWWKATTPPAHTDGKGPSCLATWHPSAVLRQGRGLKLEKEVQVDIGKFAQVVKGEAPFRFVREAQCILCHQEPVSRYDEKGLGWCVKHDPESQAGRGRTGSNGKPPKQRPYRRRNTSASKAS